MSVSIGRRPMWVAVVALGLVLCAACSPTLEGAAPRPATTFGEKFFTVLCQRVAYNSSLARGLPTDVSGSRYRQACRHGRAQLPDSAYEQDPKLAALVERRDLVVEAIDRIFPEEQLADVQRYLGDILPLIDAGLLPDAVERASAVLQDMAQDPAVTAALARLDLRLGYRPRAVAMGLVREALRYPRLHELGQTLLRAVGEQGQAHDQFLALTAALGLELRTAKRADDPDNEDRQRLDSPERSSRLALDLLLTHDAQFSRGDPRWLVRRDHRGLALVSPFPGTAQLPLYFADGDGDGLADADAQGQLRYKGEPPTPFLIDPAANDAAPLRDLYGRAFDNQQHPLYEYLDLDGTLLASLARDAVELFDPQRNTTLDLLHGVSALLGPRVPASKGDAADRLAYDGFDARQAPLLDLVHGFLQIVRDPHADDTLDLVGRLLTADAACAQAGQGCLPQLTARVIGGMFRAEDLGQAHPEARVEPSSNLYDEMIAVLRQIVAVPGLVEDLLAALQDPGLKRLPQMIANLLRYRDVHQTWDGNRIVPEEPCDGPDPLWCHPVDRGQPDSGANRSIQQRLLHIINNTNGMRICNKEGAMVKLPLIGIDVAGPFAECALFEVPNGAVFYTQSLARQRDAQGRLTGTPKAHLRLKTENMPGWMATIVNTVGADAVLRLLTGIDGLTAHPTPKAINEFLFMDPLPATLAAVQDPCTDKYGARLATDHRGTLWSWQVPHPGLSCSSGPCTFADVFRPIVQAFADHDAEHLLVDLFAVVHRHWSSKASSDYQYLDPQAPDYSAGSAIASYEPLLVEVMERTELLSALFDLINAIAPLELDSGKKAHRALAETATFLIDPAQSPGLRYRDGRAKSFTTDGKQEIPGGVSPFYLLADAFAAKNAALEAAERDGRAAVVAAWRAATTRVIDLFLEVDGVGATAQFRNLRFPAMGRALVSFLRQRVAAHAARGDVAQWVGAELPADVERVLTGPIPAAASDLVAALRADPEATAELNRLLRYLVDELEKPEIFAATLTAGADLAQLALDDVDLVPLARLIGRALRSESELVAAAVRFLEPALAADDGGVLASVLRNAFSELAPAKSPVQVLFDVAAAVHRERPAELGRYAPADFAAMLEEARDFLAHPTTGLQGFFELVKNRCGAPCPR